MNAPRLIVGLGNPGPEYEATRHNVGFWFVDQLADKLKVALAPQAKFFGRAARTGETWLLQPTTFMNRSGQSVAALANFYKIPAEEILVIHDELDLPPGGIRLKQGGGNGGHNGLKDIQAKLGTPDFWRLRIGIGHPRTLNLSQQVVDFVLHQPRKEELPDIEHALARCLLAWPKLAAGDFAGAQQQLHGKAVQLAKLQEKPMSLKCGIVGLPNVGKSTLFNALTKSGIAAENYPFCTIEPNVGIVEVPDKRMAALAAIVKPQKMQPAIVEFVDIAGLVAGASKGEGLGNQFLANIRETDAIVHVVRCFADDNVIHVSGGVDPLRDIEVIDTELALADMASVEKALNRYRRPASSGDKEAKALVAVLEKCFAQLDQAKAIRALDLSKEELALIKPFCMITGKPVLYVANVAESGFENNPLLDAVRAHAATEKAEVVSVCAAIESEIADLDDEEKQMFLADLGLEEPGLDRLIHAGYKLLGLATYFTAGVKEVRAWTIHQGDTAPQAAGVIHTDFERGFIRAQTIAFEDFITYKGEAGAKEAGKMRAEGKEYVVKDGDVMNFLFNV